MSGDYADWDTPEKHALEAYTQGAALARKAGAGASSTGATVGGGLPLVLANGVTWNQPGWECNIQANLPVGAGTRPFAIVQFVWFDDQNLVPLVEDDRYITSGNGAVAAIPTGGYGPAKGDLLQVTLTNLDPLQTLSVVWSLQQTSHLYPKDKWRQQGIPSTAPHLFVNPGNLLTSLILMSLQPTLAPGIPQPFLLPTWQGSVRAQVDNTGGANACKITITDPVGDIAPAPSMLNATIAAGSAFREDMPFLPKPMLVTLTNTGGAGNITPLVTVTAVDD